MGFRTGQANRLTRLVASLVVMAMGIFLFGPVLHLRVTLSCFGFSMAVWQGVCMARERRGKYDLTRLRKIHEREMARDEPEDDQYERDMVYCHRCDLSFPNTHSICPECGAILN